MGCRRLFLARERGICGGVRSALLALERLLDEVPGEPVYVLHELVHNRHVTDRFRRRGVRFVDTLSEVPAGARLLLGAHGAPPETMREAGTITDKLFDAGCALVRARQREAAMLEADDTLILLGYPRHAEVAGVLGWSGAGANFVISSAAEAERLQPVKRPVLISQTTFSADELEKCRKILTRRFPELRCRGGLCPASRERQLSVSELAGRVELVVVAGSAHSSNARRLCETAELSGARSLLADGAEELPERVFGFERVGLTAGASTPDEDVDKMAARFAAAGFEVIDLKGSLKDGKSEND